MTKHEYVFIRNLAWDLLIDANISQLPVDIKAIATLYNLHNLIDSSKSLYENTLVISQSILKIFGLNKPEFTKYLAIRILSPMIVLKELGIKSEAEICNFCGLPLELAKQRFKRLEMLLIRDAFETSRLETIVLSQFREWLDNY